MEMNENTKDQSKQVRYWAIGAMMVGVVASYLLKADLSWEFFQHLLLGRLIIASWDIQSVTKWVLGGATDFRPAETWLFDCLLAGVDLHLGKTWVAFVKELLLIGVISSWVIIFGRLAKDKVFGFLLGILLAFGVLLFNNTTPELVALGLFPWLMSDVQNFLKSPNAKNGFKVFLLTALYVNIHLSAIAAVLVALLLAGLERKKIPTAFVVIIISAAALLVRPYPLTQLAQFQNQFKAFLGNIIFGLEPVYHSNHELGVLLALLAGVVFFMARANTKIRADIIIATLCFLVAGISCKIYFGFSGIELAYIIAMLKPDIDESLQEDFGQAKTKLLSFVDKIPLNGGVFFMFSLAVVLAAKTISLPRIELLWPVQESEILSKNSKLFPVANTPEVGSFINYKLTSENNSPEKLAAINDFLKYFDYRLYLATRGLCDLKPGWREVFSRLNPNSVICPVDSPMYYLLTSTPSWKMISTENKNITQKQNNKVPTYAFFVQTHIKM